MEYTIDTGLMEMFTQTSVIYLAEFVLRVCTMEI